VIFVGPHNVELHVTYLTPIILRWFLGFGKKKLYTPIEEDENILSNSNSRKKGTKKESGVPFSNTGIIPNGTQDCVQEQLPSPPR
jgi:hypothetical protein